MNSFFTVFVILISYSLLSSVFFIIRVKPSTTKFYFGQFLQKLVKLCQRTSFVQFYDDIF